MDGLRIQNLVRHEPDVGQPYYTAEIVNGTHVTPVSRRWGSWLTPDARGEVKPHIAAWLQRAVGKLERAEARA